MKGKKAGKSQKWKQDEEDSDNVYDEIDRFHMEEGNVSDSERVSAKRRREELLNVEGDVSGEDDEGDFEIGSEESDFDSPEEDEKLEDALPSANKWSKKKSQFYNTSYVDEDWGGMNESDEEIAELEEEDALMRQKKLDGALAFLHTEGEKIEKAASVPMETAKSEVKLLTEEEKLDSFLERNPDFARMVEEYVEKNKILCERVARLRAAIMANRCDRRTVLEEQIYTAYRVFTSYLLNIIFYYRMKLTTGLQEDGNKSYLDDHPVIDAIIEQKKMVAKMEEFLERNESTLNELLRRYERGLPLNKLLEASGFAQDFFVKRKNSKHVEATVEEDEGEEGAVEDEYAEDVVAEEKRGISSEIQKNKGLSTKRKKGTQHSRVKKRKQYESALIKKRSQRADVRRELQPYGGEKRGIRTATVRSVKLKA